MHLDPRTVKEWPISLLYEASEAFHRKGVREREAMEKAQKEAERKSRR